MNPLDLTPRKIQALFPNYSLENIEVAGSVRTNRGNMSIFILKSGDFQMRFSTFGIIPDQILDFWDHDDSLVVSRFSVYQTENLIYDEIGKNYL